MTNRRNFLKAGASSLGAAAFLKQAIAQGPAPSAQRVYTAEKPYAAPAIGPVVRWGSIGLGARGFGQTQHLVNIPNSEVIAVCDSWKETINDKGETPVTRMQNRIEANSPSKKRPDGYGEDGDEHAFMRLLERDDIDVVLISTPWHWHAPMAKAAMEAGKHAIVEVPMGLSLEELWDLVDTSERTGKHCMMLENVNYGREELALLNMVRKGLFGEVLHGEAAYLHELRGQMKELPWGTGSWRTGYYASHNGNLYPTHGLGPIAHVMDVNRGDVATKIVSMSTPARGRKLYAEANFPPEHQWNQIPEWKCGDLSTSIIKLHSGKTILVQWDETSPRPYSRHNYIQGTRGAFGGFPNRIALDAAATDLPESLRGKAGENGRLNYHEWDNDLEPWLAEFDHPLQKRMGEEAARNGGHGGMDFMSLFRVVENLLAGAPMDQDVYDGATWSAVLPLSAASIAVEGGAVDFPDFTRGAWQARQPVPIWE